MGPPSLLPHAQHRSRGHHWLHPAGAGDWDGAEMSSQTSSSLHPFSLYFPFPAEMCSTSSVSFRDYIPSTASCSVPKPGDVAVHAGNLLLMPLLVRVTLTQWMKSKTRLEEQQPQWTIPWQSLHSVFPPAEWEPPGFCGAGKAAEVAHPLAPRRWLHCSLFPLGSLEPAWGWKAIRGERALLRFLVSGTLFPHSPDLSLGKLSVSPPVEFALLSRTHPARHGAWGQQHASINSPWGCQIPFVC